MIMRMVATYRGMVAQEATFDIVPGQHATMELIAERFTEIERDLGGPPALPMPIQIRVEMMKE